MNHEDQMHNTAKENQSVNIKKDMQSTAVNNDPCLYINFLQLFNELSDPRIILPSLYKHFTQFNNFYTAQAIFYLITEYDVECDDFLKNFYASVTNENIIIYGREFLSFIKIVLTSIKTTLKTIKSYIKRLCNIAVNIHTQLLLDILQTVHVLMRCFPASFEMLTEKSFTNTKVLSYEIYEGYLFEFDILEVGILPIKRMLARIRESSKAKTKHDRRILLEEGYTDLKFILKRTKQIEEDTSESDYQ